MMWKQVQATCAAYMSGILFTIASIFAGWKDLNVIQRIIKILFIWTSILEIVIVIVFFAFVIIGKILSAIPLVRWVYLLICYIIYLIAVLFGTIAHIYKPKQYLDNLKNDYVQSFTQAINM